MAVDEEIKYEYSKEYKECLELAKKLNKFEQINLASNLLADFQKHITHNED